MTRLWPRVEMLGLMLLALVLWGCGASSQMYLDGRYTPGAPRYAAWTEEEYWIVPMTLRQEQVTKPIPGGSLQPPRATPTPMSSVPAPGSPILAMRQADGSLVEMPHRHTQVDAKITGYIATVGVEEQFTNPYAGTIEAVYVYPLPENAGVSDFVMTIGQRHIRGIIRERTEAERIYLQARAQGYVASLLTQEQPNLFTQKVANIEPGKTIDISLRYFHTLSCDYGWFEWVFPMVAGPRTNPASVIGGKPPENAPVRYLPPGTRSGRDIALKVQVDAGVAIEELTSVNHKIVFPKERPANATAQSLELAPGDTLPNKDFVLRYKVAGAKFKTALYLQKDKDNQGGWFSLLVVPPADIKNQSLTSIRMDFIGLQARDVYPRHIPDIPAGRPIFVTGRFTGEPTGNVLISGRAADQPVSFSLPVADAGKEDNPALALVWARAKLTDLLSIVPGNTDVIAEAKKTALTYGLVSEYTRFVAVDATQRTTDTPKP